MRLAKIGRLGVVSSALSFGLPTCVMAECLGRCADRLGYFLGGLVALPLLLIALCIALFLRRPLLAKVFGAALVADLIVLWVYA
jgi:hypothetical protein